MILRDIYNPITASPFSNDEYYMEIKPHCKALVPFVKCFWGSVGSYRDDTCMDRIVNPDTCMDIIFNVNYSDNKIYDAFCGIDDRTSMVRTETAYKRVSRIAVRFYPWSAYLFTEDSLKGTQNQAIDLDYHFAEMKRIIEPKLFDIQDMRSRIAIIESYLVEHLHPERMNAVLMQAFETIIAHRGNINTLRLGSDLHISTRQLERNN